MKIRSATMADLDTLTNIEAVCFPQAEAASRESIKKRLLAFPDWFFLMENEDGQVVSFINGMRTNNGTICDEMYENAALHDESGTWFAVFGVDTLPSCQRRGYAAQVMRYAMESARKNGCKGCILTCKERLIHYYQTFGYQNLGISASVHGGAEWYDMRLTF